MSAVDSAKFNWTQRRSKQRNTQTQSAASPCNIPFIQFLGAAEPTGNNIPCIIHTLSLPRMLPLFPRAKYSRRSAAGGGQ